MHDLGVNSGMNSTFLESLQTLENKSFFIYPSPDHPPSSYFVEVVRTGVGKYVSKVNGRVWREEVEAGEGEEGEGEEGENLG